MQPSPVGMNPYTDIRKVNMRVTFRLVDLHAAQVGVPSTNGQAFVTNLSQLVDEDEVIYGKFAVLEKDFWKLVRKVSVLTSTLSPLLLC